MLKHISEFLAQPIPRHQALRSTGLMGASALGFYLHGRMLQRQMVIQTRQLAIYREASKLLMENADEKTVVELNEKLDFWRVALNMPVETMSNAPETDEEDEK